MKIFKVWVSFDNNGNIFLSDGIDYQGSIWIVSNWLNYPAEGNKKPERIIQIPKADLQHTPDSSNHLYLVKHSLPAALLSAVNQSQIPAGYVVQFLPELMFPIQS